MPDNQGDFTLQTYLDLYVQNQKVLWTEERATATTDEQRTTIDWKWRQSIAHVMDMVSFGTGTPDTLPGYYELQKVWVQRLPTFINSSTRISPSGQLYDNSGSPLEYNYAQQMMANYFGTTDTSKLTAYEQANIDKANQNLVFQQNQFAYQKEQDILDRQFQQQQLMYNQRYQQQQLQLQKQELLASLQSPVDWIKRWQVEHPKGVGGPNAPSWYDTNMGGYKDPNTGERISKPWSRDMTNQAVAYESALNRGVGVQKTPPAPAWLPQFTQSTTKGRHITANVEGQPIQKLGVVTPSGQQWTATPWSVRQGLAGYANWVGGAPLEDITQQMESMLPGTPVGASYTRWSPRRQGR